MDEKNLFAAINDLKKNYPNSWGDKEQFNVFTALRPISDEVYLHSRFIATMLDPKGLHNLGTKPLDIFLEEIGSNFSCGKNPTVRPNPRVELWKEEKEIDILIEGLVDNANVNETKKPCAIIVENKIYAKDSNHKDYGQLQGYYHSVEEKGYEDEQIETYYLTPNRHEPSEYSLSGGIDEYPKLSVEREHNEKEKHPRKRMVRCIDYGKEICQWINDVEEIATEHNLKEALKQYEQVVKKLVGDIKLNEKLTQLVSNYFKEAKINWKELCTKEYLGDKVKDIYWHCTADFFFQLEQELLNNKDGISVEIEQRPHPIHEDITYLIKGNHKNQTEKHALYYRVRDKEKGGFWRTIQASPQGFFFGLDNKQMSKAKGWKEIVYFYNPEDSKENQLPLLNLWNFLEGDTFDLLNEDKRKKIALQYALFVKDELAKLN